MTFPLTLLERSARMRLKRESGGMADTLDLGSSALRREGSNPFSRMKSKPR